MLYRDIPLRYVMKMVSFGSSAKKYFTHKKSGYKHTNNIIVAIFFLYKTNDLESLCLPRILGTAL
jgi:hypothetical protein